MNYRDILDAAFVARGENTPDDKGVSSENVQENKPVNGESADDKSEAGEKEEKSIQEDISESVLAIEKASDLIRQAKAFAVSARHDLDINRAKELDGLAGLLDRLCEMASKK